MSKYASLGSAWKVALSLSKSCKSGAIPAVADAQDTTQAITA
jgi:hypothetical protein